ncbi:MAG: beta strand repeat-containing protein [Burkholderiaceae bacterium]
MPTFPKSAAAPAFALLPLVAALAAAPAAAANFTITGSSTSAQTLGSGSGQAGTVTAGSSLTVGGGTVAVTVTGNNATLTNLGTIRQTGSGRVIRDNTGVSGLVVTNGSATNSTALMQAADADVIQMNKSPAGVTLNNYGQMISLNASAGGAQAVDFNAIASGSNAINNYTGALMRAFEADAVRPGVNGTVYNAGTILSSTTTGSSSDGVDMQNNAGVSITNDTTGLIEGGRHGITGGAADATVTYLAWIGNKAGGVIQGDNGSGINIDGFNAKELVTVVNAGTIKGYGVTGDGDGVDVDGLVDLTNSGVIRSGNAVPDAGDAIAYSEGISVGGGTITNSGTIEGLVAAGNAKAVGRGITLTGNDITTGPLAGTREGLYGNAVVNNLAGGLIRGQNDSGIAVTGARSGYTVTINNAAGGTIQGGGTAAPAILGGLDDDTVNDSGRIDGASSGKAIDLGGGNNTVNILGGHAVVLGDIDGGAGGTNALHFTIGAGNAFSYAGAISGFATVDVRSGTVTLSGASSYTGTTTVESGATLVLVGADRLAAGSALDLAGGTLRLAGVTGADAQAFASLALSGHSTLDLDGSSLTFGALGSVADGSTLAVEDAGPGTALRFAGDLLGDASFSSFLGDTTIDGLRAVAVFDGGYTDIRAIPEPANAVLLLAGLALFGLARRRRG